MTGIERRLERLEQAVSRPETMHVWAGTETLVDTIAMQFPEGVPNGVTVMGYRWANDRWADEDQAPADSRRWPG